MEFGAGIYDTKYDILKNTPVKLPSKPKQLFLGLPQWGITKWKGILYPEKTKPDQYLIEYGKRLQCVEVSSSFYAHVDREKWLKWKKSVPVEFHFLPKWPKSITHNTHLKNYKNLMKQFIDSVSVLENNLGATILQLPPNFSIEYKRELFNFLEETPSDFPITIEFRHTSWFKENRLYDKLEKYLVQKKIGMVISDTPTRQDLFHLSFCGEKNIVRYLSDDNDQSDKLRLGKWEKWIEPHTQELGGLYFVLHMPDNSKTPTLISHVSKDIHHKITQLNSGPQPSLF